MSRPHQAPNRNPLRLRAPWSLPQHQRYCLPPHSSLNPGLDLVQTLPQPGRIPPDPASLLRRHGLQVTAQRLAVLRAVIRRPHCTADQVAQDVRTEIGAISKQAVYDALRVMTEKGLCRSIQPAGSPVLYDPRVGDNHHHAICRTCGKTVDVDCAIGEAPCLTAAADAGFQIDEAEVIYWGTCPDCLRASTDQTPPPASTRPPTSEPPPSSNPRGELS